MISHPPQIDASDLYPEGFVKRILDITEQMFRQGLADGDFREHSHNGVIYYKGHDVLYYYFKHRKH